MKKLTLFICTFVVALLVCVVAVAQSPQSAQSKDLAGTWQGTLDAGSAQLRLVMKISKDDKGAYSGTAYSIDQAGPPITMGAITLQGSSVKMAMPAVGGSFQGEMEADGNSIKGTFSQGPGTLPLNLARATEVTAWEIPKPPPPPKPMTNADPSFAVVNIKLSANPEAPGFGFRVPPGGRTFSTINTTLVNLITFAYGLHPKQVSGGPSWADNTKYDITGQPDGEGVPNDKQWKIMMQKMLADRFNLAFHHEKQDLSVYTLVVAKGGSKLTASSADPNGLPGIGFGALGNLMAHNASMADFAGVMQTTAMDKPVIDQTGLTGRFDFTLKWTPDQFQFPDFAGPRPQPAADAADALPDLYTAIQQQLGLKIDATKAPVDVLVIDKVTQPTPN